MRPAARGRTAPGSARRRRCGAAGRRPVAGQHDVVRPRRRGSRRRRGTAIAPVWNAGSAPDATSGATPGTPTGTNRRPRSSAADSADRRISASGAPSRCRVAARPKTVRIRSTYSSKAPRGSDRVARRAPRPFPADHQGGQVRRADLRAPDAADPQIRRHRHAVRGGGDHRRVGPQRRRLAFQSKRMAPAVGIAERHELAGRRVQGGVAGRAAMDDPDPGVQCRDSVVAGARADHQDLVVRPGLRDQRAYRGQQRRSGLMRRHDRGDPVRRTDALRRAGDDPVEGRSSTVRDWTAPVAAAAR